MKQASTLKFLYLALLSVLGFASTACKDNRMVMYGTPYYDYKIKAAVVDQDTKKPIEGISVELNKETKLTDTAGVISFQGDRDNGLYIRLKDVDGEKNGSYIDRNYAVEIDWQKDVTRKDGSDGWYGGTILKENIVIELKQKGTNEIQ